MNLLWNMLWPLLLYDFITIFFRSLSMHLPFMAGELAAQAVSAAVAAGILGFRYKTTDISLGPGSDRRTGDRRAGDRQAGDRRAGGRRLSGFLAAALVFAGAGSCIFLNSLMELTGFTHWFAGYEPVSEVLFTPPLWLQVLAMGLLIPAAEELVFRGFMFNTLRMRYDFLAAAILSSLIFGIYHGNVVQAVYAFLIALFLAWSYERCGTILAPWLLHGAANMAAIVGERMMKKEAVSWGTVLFSGLILALSVFLIDKWTVHGRRT